MPLIVKCVECGNLHPVNRIQEHKKSYEIIYECDKANKVVEEYVDKVSW